MNRFDLEQSILEMWHTADDIQLVIDQISEKSYTTDQVLNLLIGIKTIHDLRCEKGMSILETLVHDRSFYGEFDTKD